MKVETKIFDKAGNTIMNKSSKGGDPAFFCFNFSVLPVNGERVLICDGEAAGEYWVEKPIVHEVRGEEGHPILILKQKAFEDEIRIAIDN